MGNRDARPQLIQVAEPGNWQSQKEPHGVMPARLFFGADQLKTSASKLERSNAKLKPVKALQAATGFGGQLEVTTC